MPSADAGVVIYEDDTGNPRDELAGLKLLISGVRPADEYAPSPLSIVASTASIDIKKGPGQLRIGPLD